MIVNEAMLCGCLVAASDQVGAITDFVRPPSTAPFPTSVPLANGPPSLAAFPNLTGYDILMQFRKARLPCWCDFLRRTVGLRTG